jgi:hypothetical protein
MERDPSVIMLGIDVDDFTGSTGNIDGRNRWIGMGKQL